MENSEVNGVELYYPISGITVLIGSIAFLKGLDFLAAQSADRLREMANGRATD